MKLLLEHLQRHQKRLETTTTKVEPRSARHVAEIEKDREELDQTREAIALLKQYMQSARGKYGRYLDYLDNAGEPVTVGQFSEDWAPIGRHVLNNMLNDNLITIENYRVHKKQPRLTFDFDNFKIDD